MLRGNPSKAMLDLVLFCQQKTADEMRMSDWSSDVCSSDLLDRRRAGRLHQPRWAGIGFGLLGGELVQAARFLAREEGGVDRVMVADPAPAAFERIAAALDGRDGP